MKRKSTNILQMVALTMLLGSAGVTQSQISTNNTDFARNTSKYENKEVILENAKSHQLYAIRKSDGSIYNPHVKKSRVTGKNHGKALPTPNCQYKAGYEEVRLDLGTKRYCFMMENNLCAKYKKELAGFNAKRLKFGIRSDMTIKGNVKDGFIISDYKWRQ